ncbi:MAG TPA: ABC transporter ATP-binding protein [Symbiobacteriaceae bacterium]
MIDVQNVTKRYGQKTVLDAVSLRIQPRAVTAFIGPNGAGKSTLLSIICRLVPKDGGEVWIDGKEISQYRPFELARKLSILRQTNHLPIRLTVRDLVAFGRFPHSRGRLTREDQRHVDAAIRYTGLEDLQDKYLDQLSGGQRQRAFIAMVLAQDTPYVFLDEPLNNLDMKHAVHTMQLLRRLVDDLGKTVAVVLHDINLAASYADRIVAFKDGRLIREGTTEEMVRSDVLRQVFDMEIPVAELEGCKFCIYFGNVPAFKKGSGGVG